MLLDSSFVIDLLEGLPKARAIAEEVDRAGEALRLPTPSMFELWVGAGRALRRRDEAARLEALALAYEVTLFDAEDARRAGTLQALLSKEGRSLGTVDAQIAGMCLARDEVLLTGDQTLSTIGHGVRTRTYNRT